MKTNTKERGGVAIPEDKLEEIKVLERAVRESKIRAKCADARVESAVKAGEDDRAIKEVEISLEMDARHDAAHDAMWDKIHEVLPELDREADYRLDTDEWMVEPARERNPLAEMFGRG